MTKTKDASKIDIPPRQTRRVRLDLETEKADKLRAYAESKGRSQAQVVEFFIDKLK